MNLVLESSLELKKLSGNLYGVSVEVVRKSRKRQLYFMAFRAKDKRETKKWMAYFLGTVNQLVINPEYEINSIIQLRSNV